MALAAVFVLPFLYSGHDGLNYLQKAQQRGSLTLLTRNGASSYFIGPEGGFIEYEIEKLKETGFEAVHLGPRILRVENAVPTILGRLF